MSLCRIHLKKLISQAANNGQCHSGRHPGLCHRWFLVASPQPWNIVDCVRKALAVPAGIRLYSTGSEEPSGPPVRKKKENPNARRVIANVGRFIPYNFIQVINEHGEDLGRMNRRDVLKITEESGLKLVLLRENAEPPLYKLMTGKQLYEEQSKLRERQKLHPNAGPIQIKEVSFLAGISKHDLDIKVKQISQWIEKKHNVKITVINSRTSEGPDKEAVLQQLLKSMQDFATCSSNPKERKDGRAVVCVLRPLSDKELQKLRKDQVHKPQEEQIKVQATNQEQDQDTATPTP